MRYRDATEIRLFGRTSRPAHEDGETPSARRGWARQLGRVVRRVVVPLALFELAMVLIFRTRQRRVIDLVRAFNRHVLNPVMLRVAGRRHWYAAVLHHVGRRSGRAYATPVWAEPVAGGFVIPLPYGTGVDWYRNVEAAGACTIAAKGEVNPVGQPGLLGASVVLPALPLGARLLFRLYGVDQFVQVKTRTPSRADRRADGTGRPAGEVTAVPAGHTDT